MDLRREAAAVAALLRRDVATSVTVASVAIAVIVVAFAFPATRAGGVAALALVAATGAVIARAGERLDGKAPRWLGPAIAYGVVLVLAWLLFDRAWEDGLAHNLRDWGTQHALVVDLARALAAGDGAPRWVHGVSTGDAPYELYPALTTYVAAHLAIAFDCTSDVPLVLGRLAIAVHVSFAVAAVRLTRRVAPWPIAAVAGVAVLFDRGDAASGGSRAILYFGLLHSGLALCVWGFVVSSIVDAVARPQLRTTVFIWIAGALGVAAHPIGLVVAAGVVVALAGVALLACDVPRRRSLVAAFHVCLAVALAAVVWMPLSERLVHYGVAYGTAPQAAWEMFEHLSTRPLPGMSLAVVVYLGYAGAVAAVFSRRAAPTFVALLAGVFLLGYCDQLYVLFDLAPSQATARGSAQRLLWLAKLPIVACGGYLAALVVRHGAGAWSGARRRMLLGAACALLAAWFARGAVPYADEHAEKIRDGLHEELPEEAGFDELIAWAKQRAAEQDPGRYARLLFDGHANYVYHLRAETGLPTLWVGPVSNYLLRERITGRSDEQLARFNVRWVAAKGRPPALGDPDTEFRIGAFRIREVAGWDGAFARVERGGGRVVVTRLDDAAVEVDLRDTDTPSLVALGTGYYPRWRARTAGGDAVAVYALPFGDGAHIVAAWLPPGTTVFTPDGALPSDGDGLWLALLAALLAVAMCVVWQWPRARLRVLRGAARGLARLRTRRRAAALAAAWTVAAVLAGAVAWSRCQPTPALQLGNGLAGDAEVEARRPGQPWRSCAYSAARGSYRCADLVTVYDTMRAIIDDAPPSWNLVTPTIRARVEGEPPVDLRIRVSARLDGAYSARAEGADFQVSLAGGVVDVGRGRVDLDTGDGERRYVLLTATLEGEAASITFVRTDRIEPDRAYPVPPARGGSR